MGILTGVWAYAIRTKICCGDPYIVNPAWILKQDNGLTKLQKFNFKIVTLARRKGYIDSIFILNWTYNGISHCRGFLNKKNYNMKYHVILGRFKWLINVSPSLEGIRYPRSVYVLSFVCFFLLLLLFLYSLEKQFGWFLTHISRLHI